MQIDRPLILKLETLSKLELTEAERTKIGGDLEKILSMVAKLEELDTAGVEPLAYVSDAQNNLREDVVNNQVSQQAALKNAPDQDGEYFKVPKVL